MKRRHFDPFTAPARNMSTPAVVLCDPKFPHNLGTVVRAASCFSVEQVWITGTRLAKRVREARRIPREERMRDYRDVAMVLEEHPLRFLPEGAIPVAIELLPGAENLTTFEHPEHAVYLFGPEDGSIPSNLRGALSSSSLHSHQALHEPRQRREHGALRSHAQAGAGRVGPCASDRGGSRCRSS